MTGVGTQADPYIVDNWEDFMSINRNQIGIYVKWADSDNKVIDFNDIKPDGYTTSIIFPSYVDFNGWTLRNFRSTASYAMKSNNSNSVTVQNLIIENFYISNESYNYLFYYTNISNSIISGIAVSGKSFYLTSYGDIVNSSVNIKVTAKEEFSILNSSGIMKNSDIVLDVSAKTANLAYNSYYHGVYNSRISGKIHSAQDYVRIVNGYSNIFNLDSDMPLSYSGTAISVYNSDLAEKDSSSTNLIGCTTEQLKNAEYLYSIGFPIGVD